MLRVREECDDSLTRALSVARAAMTLRIMKRKSISRVMWTCNEISIQKPYDQSTLPNELPTLVQQCQLNSTSTYQQLTQLNVIALLNTNEIPNPNDSVTSLLRKRRPVARENARNYVQTPGASELQATPSWHPESYRSAMEVIENRNFR